MNNKICPKETLFYGKKSETKRDKKKKTTVQLPCFEFTIKTLLQKLRSIKNREKRNPEAKRTPLKKRVLC